MELIFCDLLPYLRVLVGEDDDKSVSWDQGMLFTDQQLRDVLAAADVLDEWIEKVRAEAMRRGWKVEPPDHPDAAQIHATENAIYEGFRQANAVKFGLWPSGQDDGNTPPAQPEPGREDGDKR